MNEEAGTTFGSFQNYYRLNKLHAADVMARVAV
jgi:hypothetical protein